MRITTSREDDTDNNSDNARLSLNAHNNPLLVYMGIKGKTRTHVIHSSSSHGAGVAHDVFVCGRSAVNHNLFFTS